MTPGIVDEAAAREADRLDPLRGFRGRFVLDPQKIYLDGNSLGPPPLAAGERVADAIGRQWAGDLVAGWNRHAWITAPRRVGDKIGRLIGAEPGETIVADSVSVNLFKLLSAAVTLRPERRKILVEAGDFPTDLYIAQGVAGQTPGVQVVTAPWDRIAQAVDDETCVVLASHVNYRTARKLGMPRLTAAVHARGALMLWDLSHSVGAVPIDLDGCDVDLAVGCGYKYLNGGPGAPAFLFVRRDLQSDLKSPLSGWMGHADPFAFTSDYLPMDGVERFLCGTPPILSLVALEVGVDLMLEADMARVAEKSAALSDLLIARVEALDRDYGLKLACPASASERGGHVAFRHPNAFEICQALIAAGVTGDFRAPDLLRFGIAPLFNGYVDIHRTAEALEAVMAEDEWRRPEHAIRARVT